MTDPLAPRRARKNPKTTPAAPGPTSKVHGPIPQPYLALAPSSVTAISAPTPYSFPSPSQSSLILPSNYKRGNQSSVSLAKSVPSNAGPSISRTGYGAGLLAPPTIMPGGQSAPPRVQGGLEPPQNPRRRAADRVGVGGGRREERLRNLQMANASMTSLGQLGQIMESDRMPEEQSAPVPQRRRRRIVRGEAEGLSRRLTVTTREEGRALGLARGASMRRVNVWDGQLLYSRLSHYTHLVADLPESSDAPPAFPFPTSATNRLPPTFEAVEASATSPPTLDESDLTTPTGSPLPQITTVPPSPPRSPPPTWEQATGLVPLSEVPDHSAAVTSTHRARPLLTLATSSPSILISHDLSGPSSPGSTHYALAPNSPTGTVISIDEEMIEEERADRRMWNADLLAGYSLEERVRREVLRRTRAEGVMRRGSAVEETMLAKAKAEPPDRITSRTAVKEAQTAVEDDSTREEMPATEGEPATPTLAMSPPTPAPEVRDRISETLDDIRIPTPTLQPEETQDAFITPTLDPTSAVGDPAVIEVIDLSTSPTPPETPPVSPPKAVLLAGPDPAPDAEAPSDALAAHPPVDDIPAAPDLMEAVTIAESTQEALTPSTASPVEDAAGFETTCRVETAEPPETTTGAGPVEQLGQAASTGEAMPRNGTLTSARLSSLEGVRETPILGASTATTKFSIESSSDQLVAGPPTESLASVAMDEVSGEINPTQAAVEKSPAPSSTAGFAAKSVAGPSLNEVSDMSPSVRSRLPSVEEQPVNASSEAAEDVVLGIPPPTRKLTRGKAIRRSSSGLKSSPSSASRRSSKRDSDPPPPLFASPNYAFPSSSPQPALAELQRSPEPVRVGFVHRVSAPTIQEEHVFAARSRASRLSADQTAQEKADRLLPIEDSRPGFAHVSEASPSTPEPVLLPHREAAMKRRELALAASRSKSEPVFTRSKSGPVMPSGPLIDLSDWSHRVHPEHWRELLVLAPSTAELLLLQLLEEELTPVAETSAQAAARAAAMGTPPPSPPKAGDTSRPASIISLAFERRTPPPPPPPLRVRSPHVGQEGLSRKPSILSTASSPITPMPIHPPTCTKGSPTPRALRPSFPTRRPPPPPPLFLDKAASAEEETPIDSPPPVPLRPPPPAFESRPTHDRKDSSFTSSTSSSISEKASVLAAPTLSAWRAKPRSVMLSRPRGPRPPPPPPRPWARVVIDTLDLEPAPRPVGDRTSSEIPLVIDTSEPGSPLSARSPIRSASAQTLRSRISTPRRPEYTDLDVLVSRLEGSGREYEVG